MQDLAKRNGQAVDMQCIVYEIPLPPLHWYNWPNSGSRLISNGCHWIDYFMFVNDYADVEDYGVWKPRGSDVCTYIRLNNQAYFTMSLTETGSQRLGVRDIIQLRWGPVTITMTDSASYESEDGNRTVRRRKVNPMHAYRNMYRKIAEKISKGEPGDTLESLSSSRLVLLLEDAVRYK
jgi:predicted dehydrogenase